MSSSATPRRRNPRGQGSRLREEILDAAIRLIDEQGAAAVTLRAVAREARISAPSIYAHFEDRQEILDDVVQRCFAELATAIGAARDALEDPVARLEAGCDAYLRFAESRPQRYALMFVKEPPGLTEFGAPDDQASAAFTTLVAGIADCAAAGRSTSVDPFADAVVLWSALHGYATLECRLSSFPWPERADSTRRIIHGLARIPDPD